MTDDTRVQCTRCGNYRNCRCFEPIRAGLSATSNRPMELAPELAELLQHCPAHQPRELKK